jgi:alkenylglycerophosphocholine/alkenylglycerophosphoethanolamine hydrolase
VRRVGPNPSVTRFGPTLAGIGIATALLFFLGMAADVPALRAATKPLPALVLAAWVLLGCRGPLRWFTAAGLGLSAIGDGLLENGLFLPGLLAFLGAHLAYVASFLASDRRPALGRAAPFLAWGVAALAFLWPGLGAMAAPVTAYVAVIGTMMWRAAARVGSPRTPALSAALGLAGAVAFGASDTLIAVDRFAMPIPGAAWPIMLLYWLGQCGIAASAVAACGILPGQVRTR